MPVLFVLSGEIFRSLQRSLICLQRVVELIRDRLPAPGQNQALRDTYLKALVEVRSYDEAGDVLREEIALAEKPSRLRRLSRLGLETGQVEEAENGFLRLLSILPDDGESLKWAGQLAYTRAAYSEIGHFFGDRAHSTVISAENKVNRWVSDRSAILLRQGNCRVEDAIRRVEDELRVG